MFLKRLLLTTTLALATPAFAFDVAGIQIGDELAKFDALNTPAKEFMTVTTGEDGRIVRIIYQQAGLENDEETQAKLVRRICDKYGWETPCYIAMQEIEGNDKRFLDFFHFYRNKERTEQLRARIKRTKAFSLTPDLTVELDLMDSNYAKSLQEQRKSASDLIKF
ncbi:MAG: hypothetical protein ACO3TX_14695 [Pseudomonadales bacterium]|nr:hypothetical protein [Gammaproteobacteria bacterium]